MNTDEKILKVLEDLQTDVKAMKGDVGKIPAIEKQLEQQGKRLETLETGQKTLEAGQQALDLKVEAIHDFQKKAHTEIMVKRGFFLIPTGRPLSPLPVSGWCFK